MTLLVKDKEIVVPGDELAKGMDNLPGRGTYRDNDQIISARLGIVSIDGRTLKIIPLSGRYMPKKFDTIIGQVTNVLMSGWLVETKSAYEAMLSMKEATSDYIEKGADLTQYFKIGDYIVAKIVNVTSQNLVDLSMRGPGLHKLRGGRIIQINTYKVPRVIGKQGSMVSMIKNATGCKITVGQNGVVWISGTPEQEILAVETIEFIEKNSHVSGLTEEVKKMLEKKTGKKIEEVAAPVEERGNQNE